MRIALATCTNLPAWEVDDAPLHAALGRLGVEVVRPSWDDATFDWRSCDACLIRTTWDYMERRQEFIAWANRVESLIPLFNSAAVVRWNTHKSYLRCFGSRGVPTVPTVWLQAGDKPIVREIMAQRGWNKGFIKPAIGATARETLPFDADGTGLAQAQAHLDRMVAHEDMLLQPFLDSVLLEGEYSAIWIDGEITHTVRKIPVSGDYRVQDDFGATDEPCDFSPWERGLAADVIDSIAQGMDLLYARADFLRDEAGSLRLTEFEAVEPSLFFRHSPAAAERLAMALVNRITTLRERGTYHGG